VRNSLLEISAISFFARWCVFGLLSIFVLNTVVLPFTDIQNSAPAIAENTADTASELETEALDELFEAALENLLPVVDLPPNEWAELAVAAENNLQEPLFGPPPELI
jgi:hypothetical protein